MIVFVPCDKMWLTYYSCWAFGQPYQCYISEFLNNWVNFSSDTLSEMGHQKPLYYLPILFTFTNTIYYLPILFTMYQYYLIFTNTIYYVPILFTNTALIPAKPLIYGIFDKISVYQNISYSMVHAQYFLNFSISKYTLACYMRTN